MVECCRVGRADVAPLDERVETLALVLLERYPLPFIASADDGAVLFANAALAEILGCTREAVTLMRYEDVFKALPVEETLFAVARLCADDIRTLLCLDGSTIFVKMSKAATVRGAGAFAIATFRELIERLSELAGGVSSYSVGGSAASTASYIAGSTTAVQV